MDAATLAQAMGNRTDVDYRQYVDGCNAAMVMASITTIDRAAMWLAQIGEESGGLRYMQELASGAEYEGRTDLGNLFPGDGSRFKGRGPIQITGRHNYYLLSVWAHQRGLVPTEDYFVTHPEDLMLPQYVWLGPVWYWTVARPGINADADRQDIQGVTRAVNGGLNGLQDRTNRYWAARQLGNRLLPTPTENTTSGDDMSAAEVADLKAYMDKQQDAIVARVLQDLTNTKDRIKAFESEILGSGGLRKNLRDSFCALGGQLKTLPDGTSISSIGAIFTALRARIDQAASRPGQLVDLTAIRAAAQSGAAKGINGATIHGGQQ